MEVDQQPFPDEPSEPEVEPTTTAGAFGPDTQALFAEDDPNEFRVPDLEITPSPNKSMETMKKTPTPSKFLTNTRDWVLRKANRYDVDPNLIWYVLERTTGRPKLAIKTLKSFIKTNGIIPPHIVNSNG
jgi:hypothetical protein